MDATVGGDQTTRKGKTMFKFAKITIATAALIAFGASISSTSQAGPAWFGPGSGPFSPYANYKGFAQVPRQFGGYSWLSGHSNYTQPYQGTYRCVPNVGLVGANGVCPD
jgi:hypothetical protein